MPRVISEALAEPDVLATFVLLVAASSILAVLLSPRIGRPRWLIALALMSVAAIVAATVVPQGGWSSLSGAYLQSLGDCLGPAGWPRLGRIAADTLLNVVLYIPAGFLWVVLTRKPIPVIIALALLCIAIESWQAASGGRSCTVNDIGANTLGAVIGASLGVIGVRVLKR
jgi:glycopeptide antibiotics resistance protein